jgi:hypothetical protein
MPTSATGGRTPRPPSRVGSRTSGTDPTTPGDTYWVTDPLGRPGEGFTFEVKPSTETLIIDPDTGRLLATVGIDERDRTSWSAYVRAATVPTNTGTP